ncbi:MAG: hypothetical protein ABJP90_01785 [Paracoccaceae bacterium]
MNAQRILAEVIGEGQSGRTIASKREVPPLGGHNHSVVQAPYR